MDAETKKRLEEYGWDLPSMKEDIKDLDERADETSRLFEEAVKDMEDMFDTQENTK